MKTNLLERIEDLSDILIGTIQDLNNNDFSKEEKKELWKDDRVKEKIRAAKVFINLIKECENDTERKIVGKLENQILELNILKFDFE